MDCLSIIGRLALALAFDSLCEIDTIVSAIDVAARLTNATHIEHDNKIKRTTDHSAHLIYRIYETILYWQRCVCVRTLAIALASAQGHLFQTASIQL